MAEIKFRDDVDLGLCELQNHILHIVGTQPSTTQGQIYFNTGSSLNQLEYYDGSTNHAPITAIDVSDESSNTFSLKGSKVASLTFSGSGVTTDASTAGTVVIDNDHQTIQSMTDLNTTPGSGTDGYALLWNNTGSYFELVDLATVTTSGSFVTTDTIQTIVGKKTFSAITTFNDNVIIDGDLTVSGAHTLTTPETVVIEDNLLYLNSNHTGAPTQDAGFLINRGSSTNVGFIWDEGNNRFELIQTTDTGSGTDLGATTWVDLVANAGRFEGLVYVGGEANFVGDINYNSPGTHTIGSSTEIVARDSGTNTLEVIPIGTFRSEFGSNVTGTITGNGSLTTFTFTHNLGTLAADITVIEDSSGDKIYTSCRNTSTTQSQISFKYAVANLKTYTVIAQG